MSGMEVVMIIGGFSGVLVMCNDTFLFSESAKVIDQHLIDDNLKYPKMHLGILLAFGYTIFSSLNYLKMREMGNQIHSAIKTYYFGLLCTGLSLVYATYMDPTILKLWLIGTKHYPISLA